MDGAASSSQRRGAYQRLRGSFHVENHADHRLSLIDGARGQPLHRCDLADEDSERRDSLVIAAEAVLDKQSSPVSARRHRCATVQHQSQQCRAPICPLPAFVWPSANRQRSVPSTTTSCRCCQRSPRLIVCHRDDAKVHSDSHQRQQPSPLRCRHRAVACPRRGSCGQAGSHQ